MISSVIFFFQQEKFIFVISPDSRCHNIFSRISVRKKLIAKEFFVIVQEFKDISVNECSKSDLAQLKQTYLQNLNPLTNSSEQFCPPCESGLQKCGALCAD